MKICKTAETREIINFLSSKYNLHGLPEKNKSDKGGAFVSIEYHEFWKKPKHRIGKWHIPNAYGKRSDRQSNTDIEKSKKNKLGRRFEFNLKCEPSHTSTAIYNTYGTKVNTIRTAPR